MHQSVCAGGSFVPQPAPLAQATLRWMTSRVNPQTGTPPTPPPARTFTVPKSSFKNMKNFANQLALPVVSAVFFTSVSTAAHAGIVSFASRADFEAALKPGAYTEPLMYAKYPNYSGSVFSYSANASGGRWAIGADLSTGNPGSITFNFGPGITAFGGYFYNTNIDGSLNASPITISLDNGTFSTAVSSPNSATFFGFASSTNFLNASIGSGLYPVVGTVIVGSAAPAPVPGPLPLLGAGAAFSLSRRLRRRRAVGHSDS